MSRIKQLLPPPSGAGEAFGLLGDAEQRLRLVDAFLLLETQQTSRSSITDHKQVARWPTPAADLREPVLWAKSAQVPSTQDGL